MGEWQGNCAAISFLQALQASDFQQWPGTAEDSLRAFLCQPAVSPGLPGTDKSFLSSSCCPG